MEHVEFTGKTTEDALRAAEEHFGVSLDQLEVEVISAGSGGFFGILGAKKAVIKARPQGKSAADEVAQMMADFTESATPTALKPKPKAPPKPRPAPQPASRPAAPAAPQPDAAEAGPDQSEMMANAQQVLERLTQALDPKATVEVVTAEHGPGLSINGADSGVVIGRRGQTLDALQYLTTRIVSHKYGKAVHIAVDAGGYRQRRRASLEDTARRLADKARSTRKAQSVGPLNPQERRLVHLVLRSQRGISTVSRGKGEMKKVVITPR